MTNSLPPFAQAVAGGVGAVVANVGSFPLDVVVTRIQTQKYSRERCQSKLHVFHLLSEIVHHEGFRGLYVGFDADAVSTIVSSVAYFYSYAYFRNRLLDKKRAKAVAIVKGPIPGPYPYPPRPRVPITLSTFEEVYIGFFGSVIGRFLSLPFECISVKMRYEQGRVTDRDATGYRGSISFTRIMKYIHREEGLRGFFKGFKASVFLCLQPAFALMIVKFFRLFIRLFYFLRGKEKIFTSNKPGLIGGSLSSLIALSFFYPLMMLKTRVQCADCKEDKSTFKMFREVVRNRGIGGLYDGFGGKVCSNVVNKGCNMLVGQRVMNLFVTIHWYWRHKTLWELYANRDPEVYPCP
ncbi:hypothetical protein FRB99_004633 [Tulasnella sp. 403]|nr:hypothetical protein FRB99_004633 [Tulasnella sp. 403]